MEDQIRRSAETHGYSLGQRLGNGAFGVAYKVTKIGTGETFVLKAIQCNGHAAYESAKQEATLHELNGEAHPNIVRCYESWYENYAWTRFFRAKAFRGSAFLINQYCAKGCIVPGKYPAADVVKWTRQLLSALAFLHQRNICHRDIKPDNLFLNEQKDLLIGDLGISRVFEKDGATVPSTPAEMSSVNVTLRTQAGTPMYMAPEVYRGAYDTKADIFSAGLSIFCILHDRCVCIHGQNSFGILEGGLPLGYAFHNQDQRRCTAIRDKLFKSVTWRPDTYALRDILKEMLHWEREQRKSAQELLVYEKARPKDVRIPYELIAIGIIIAMIGYRYPTFALTAGVIVLVVLGIVFSIYTVKLFQKRWKSA